MEGLVCVFLGNRAMYKIAVYHISVDKLIHMMSSSTLKALQIVFLFDDFFLMVGSINNACMFYFLQIGGWCADGEYDQFLLHQATWFVKKSGIIIYNLGEHRASCLLYGENSRA